jgi:hypothetical protein
VWDAETDLAGWQPANYGLIEDVRLESDGTGVMTLRPLRFPHGSLSTADGGRTWLPVAAQ